MLYCLKHQWAANPKMSMKLEIIDRATELIHELSTDVHKAKLDSGLSLPRFTIVSSLIHTRTTKAGTSGSSRSTGEWDLGSPEAVQQALLPATTEAPSSVIQLTADEINKVFDLATKRAPTWGKLWHKQGIFNMLVLREWIATNRRPLQDCTYIISTSVMAFFKSVTMHNSGSRHETLQVCLRYGGTGSSR